MKFFRRRPSNKQQLPGDIPKEVEEYYESTRKERTGVAWLLGLATMLLIVLVAIALYFGGRFVYRSVVDNWFNDDTPSEVADPEDTNGQQEAQDDADSPDGPPFVTDDETEDEQPARPDEQNGAQRTPTPGATDIPRTGPIDE